MFLILLIVIFSFNRCSSDFGKQLPNFKVYWNVPTFMCKKYGFNFSSLVEKWEIIQNSDDEFRGNKISILYDPGLFPALLNTTVGSAQEPRNGGVPQEGNLQRHLEKLAYDIERLITDRNFRGLGIIDFEHWRPIWRENWSSLNSYRTYSREIERNAHPFWSNNMIENWALARFEKAAKDFMHESLKLAKNMRPSAVWGYYGYPFCFNYTPNNNRYKCSNEVIEDNNRLKWLFSENTALYPSVYLRYEGMSTSLRAKYILGRMEEATRISETYLKLPIYVYTWYKYSDVGRFLSKEDLFNSFNVPKNSGVSGIIIWGATNDVNSKLKCAAFFDYLDRILGPTIEKVLNNKKHWSIVDYEDNMDLNEIILINEIN